MIHVTIRVGGGMAGIMGTKSEVYEIEDGTNLHKLIEILRDKIGDEILQPTTVIVFNGTKINDQDIKSLILKDGDVVSLFKVLVGG